MNVTVQFFSYFKDLAGTSQHVFELSPGASIGALLGTLYQQFPKLEPMRKSMLIAVGVEYQDRNYILQDGDVVSLFPPVQGG
jgi:molybdopterin synthase sulfur carrier subunit